MNHSSTILWILRRNIPSVWESQHSWTGSQMTRDAEQFALRLFKWSCENNDCSLTYCCVKSANAALHAALASTKTRATPQLFFQARTFTVHTVDLSQEVAHSLQHNDSDEFAMSSNQIFWQKENILFRQTRSVDSIVEWIRSQKNVSCKAQFAAVRSPCEYTQMEAGIQILDVWSECLLEVGEQSVACRLLCEINQLLHHAIGMRDSDRETDRRHLKIDQRKDEKKTKKTQNRKKALSRKQSPQSVACRSKVIEALEVNVVADSDRFQEEFQQEMTTWSFIE